jgi:hypothetical protein
MWLLGLAMQRTVAMRVPYHSKICAELTLISNTNSIGGSRTNPSCMLGNQIGLYANVSESSAVISAGIQVLMLAVKS